MFFILSKYNSNSCHHFTSLIIAHLHHNPDALWKNELKFAAILPSFRAGQSQLTTSRPIKGLGFSLSALIPKSNFIIAVFKFIVKSQDFRYSLLIALVKVSTQALEIYSKSQNRLW